MMEHKYLKIHPISKPAMSRKNS